MNFPQDRKIRKKQGFEGFNEVKLTNFPTGTLMILSLTPAYAPL